MAEQQPLQTEIKNIFTQSPRRLVFSAARQKSEYRRAVAEKKQAGWQVELFTQTQAFHKNLSEEKMLQKAEELLQHSFTQLTAFTGEKEIRLKITKKGGVLKQSVPLAKGAAKAPMQEPSQKMSSGKSENKNTAGARNIKSISNTANGHNRQKNRILQEGTAVAPLVDIGIMTADGRVAAHMQDKYRQINRFLEIVDDALKAMQKAGQMPQTLRVIDFGCGKSYLTFVLYYYLTEIVGINAQITGLDLKKQVVENCSAAAKKYGYSGLAFEVGDIAGYEKGAGADMVVSLHACDTATDHALANAVKWGAGLVFSVPCCQHQLCGQMQSEELALLTRYGIVKERTAALITDAIRANLMAACGYKTQLVEFVGFEHTPKNIMIRAFKTKIPAAQRKKYLDEVKRMCAAFSFEPCLLGLLDEAGKLP